MKTCRGSDDGCRETNQQNINKKTERAVIVEQSGTRRFQLPLGFPFRCRTCI